MAKNYWNKVILHEKKKKITNKIDKKQKTFEGN